MTSDPRAYADVLAEQERQQAAAAEEGPTLEQLREQARARGLPVSGTKAELQDRLAQAPPDE
jgi:hypothetical protein